MYTFWILSGIIFLVLDILKKKNIYMSLALTSMFCSIITNRYPENIYSSIVVAPVFFMIFYAFINKIMKNEQTEKEMLSQDIIGKTALVTKDIGKTLSIDGIGQIKINDTYWKAKNITDKEIKAGKRVEIVSGENTILNVRIK